MGDDDRKIRISTKKWLGYRIRRCRVAKGVSQEKLQAEAGLAHPQVWRYETGMTEPSIGSLLLICNVLGVTVDELLRWEDGDEEDHGTEDDDNGAASGGESDRTA